MSRLVPLARNLRQNSTDAERIIWRHLRDRKLGGWKFRRQSPVGKYILDFVCFESRVAVEIDGRQHAESNQASRDSRRDEWLASQGFKVLRFWNHEVIVNVEGALKRIMEECQRTLTTSSPIEGEVSSGVSRIGNKP